MRTTEGKLLYLARFRIILEFIIHSIHVYSRIMKEQHGGKVFFYNAHLNKRRTVLF